MEAYLACGRVEEAERLFDSRISAMRDLDRRPAEGLDRIWWVDALIAEGLLRDAQGRWDESRTAFEEALAFIHEVGGRPAFSHGIAAHAYGTLLARRGDIDAGRTLLAEALGVFRLMSAALHAERTEHVLAEMGLGGTDDKLSQT
jgi:hypothetical protein